MDNLSSIKESIRKIVGGRAFPAFTAKVEGVDGETCSVSIDGVKLTDVRLRAVVNGEDSKILVTPKVGSYVLLTDLSGGKFTDLAVISYSEVDKIEITADDKIVINGGDNNGLVKIDKLTEKLNELVEKFNTHTHPVPNGTSSLTSTQASVFNKSDYEDTKITH